MTNFFKLTILWLTICLFSSCQEETYIDEPSSLTTSTLELNSSMSNEEFMINCLSVKEQLKSTSRALQLTNAEAQQLIQPFVNDGQNLKLQIVKQVNNNPSLQLESVYFNSLSDEDCAVLSFVFHTMKSEGMDASKVIGLTNDVQTQKSKVDSERIVHCLAVAAGYDFLKNISVKGIVSAATIRQAIIAIGKRYLGYVGVALIVYDFMGCLG